MKTNVVLRVIAPLLSVLTVFSAAAQEEPEPVHLPDAGYNDTLTKPSKKQTEAEDPDRISIVVDEPAEYPGGITAMRKYLSENLVYPEAVKKGKVRGKVYLKFVVSKEGDISNIQIFRGIEGCSECDAEALRVVQNMPKWKPGRIKGEAVNSTFNLPISFILL